MILFGRTLVVASLLLGAGCSPVGGPRDVLLVARGMTFMLPSDPDAVNPVIRVRAGERLRVTLRNDAPGLMHNFEIPAWEVKTDQIRGGSSTSVTLTVPAQQGRYQYICAPHANLMRGFVEVIP
jgi:heme/copper-type cytochrome/quinol oxidase subunit 2